MRADAWRLGIGVLVLGALLVWLLGGGPTPEREPAAMPEFAWPVQPLEPATPTSTISGTVRDRAGTSEGASVELDGRVATSGPDGVTLTLGPP